MDVSASPEFAILDDCAEGLISTDHAFEQLYELYGPTVRNWARVAGGAGSAEDLFQDTWVVFYTRWQSWAFSAATGPHTGRPVLSFLYRTLQFVLRGYRRRARPEDPIVPEEISDDRQDAQKLEAGVELRRLLDLSRRICPQEEMDVLLGKLAGMQGAEIAEALRVTPATVDHRYRSAIARLQESTRRKSHGK